MTTLIKPNIHTVSRKEITPWENLAEAIIVQAAKDYRKALIERKLHTIKECEEFFHSEMYYSLTNVPGESIINKIKGEVNESFTNSSNPQTH